MIGNKTPKLSTIILSPYNILQIFTTIHLDDAPVVLPVVFVLAHLVGRLQRDSVVSSGASEPEQEGLQLNVW